MPYEWLEADEYPDDDDIARYGDDSPIDDDPRTIGFVDGANSGFWTVERVIIAVIAALIVAALALPFLLTLF